MTTITIIKTENTVKVSASGPQGATGEGVPVGGNSGQILAKNSNTNYDTEWIDQPEGITDHGALSGLSDDDHAQYHNDTRGDARYYTQAQSNLNFEPKNSNIQSHISSTSNPHSVTKTQVGLGNVVNLDTSTTANITDALNKRFVTDALLAILANTSGVNTGDQDLSNYVPYLGAAADIDLGNSQKVTNSQEPVNPQDLATKNYIDTKIVFDDLVPVTSLDTNLRELYDSLGSLSINYENRGLVDDSGTDSVAWGSRTLASSTGITSIDWEGKVCYDDAGDSSLSWQGKELLDGGLPIIKWKSDQLKLLRQDATTGVDWLDNQLNDSVNNIALDWENKILYSSNFPFVDLNWNNGTWVSDNGGVIDIYYNTISNSVGIIDFNNGTISSGNGIIDYANGKLQDTFFTYSLDYNLRETFDSFGATSCAWGTRQLFDTNGSSGLSLDWGSRTLDTGNFVGGVAYNWSVGWLFAGDGSLAIDHGARAIYDASTNIVFDFSAQQPSSGAQTAGGTYGTTEQTMIQEMYDALRTYGLLA
jgi:hypothetical protein